MTRLPFQANVSNVSYAKQIAYIAYANQQRMQCKLSKTNSLHCIQSKVCTNSLPFIKHRCKTLMITITCDAIQVLPPFLNGYPAQYSNRKLYMIQ